MKYLLLTIIMMLSACSMKPKNEFITSKYSTHKTDKIRLDDSQISIAFFKNPLMEQNQIAMEVYVKHGYSIMDGNSLAISLDGALYSFTTFKAHNIVGNYNVKLYPMPIQFLDQMVNSKKVEFNVYVDNKKMKGKLSNSSKKLCKQFLDKVM